MEDNWQNIISASDTSIGFDYQFYYFFYLLLDLHHGERIGLEVKDDIHVELPDGNLVLIQTKHTLQVTSGGDTINLTERDKDLWKTISNWIKIINEQIIPSEFIKTTAFKLVTNKSTSKNSFIIHLKKLQDKEINTRDFKTYLTSLHDSTTDTTICNYINDLRNLKSKLLNEFCCKISFDFNQDDLIQEIKKRLLENIHIKERVEDVYKNLHSELRDSNYLSVKEGERIIISFEDFNKKFRNCFKVALSNKLPLRTFDFPIPDKPNKQLFIRQLVDIEDITYNDRDEIIEFTTQMLQLYNNLKTWEEDGDLLSIARKKFDSETHLIWRNTFKMNFHEIKLKLNNGIPIESLEDEIKIAAVKTVNELRKQILHIDDTSLNMELSNGQFYLLTESSQIGWHYEWEKKYSK